MYSASLFLENLTLACVDRGDVEEVWETLKSTLPTDLHDSIDYYERTWIGTSESPPLFSPLMWNHDESLLAGLPHSVNIAKGWHNGFASMLSVPNPTIWHFLHGIKIEQGLTVWKIVKKQMKEPAAPRVKRWIEYVTRLHALIGVYEDEEDKLTFLKRVGTMLSV